MKRLSTFLLLALLAMPSAFAERVTLSTPHLSLVLDVNQGQAPMYRYFGTRINAADVNNLATPLYGHLNAYPAYGLDITNNAALAMTHSDGNMSTALKVTGFDEQEDDKGKLLTIHLNDPVYPVFVDLKYRAFKDVDMLETWTEITNKEKGKVTLTTFSSGMLPIRRGNVWLSHLAGTWANEAQLMEEELHQGKFVITNRDGVRNAQTSHAEVMFSLDGKPQEETGDVIGAALCYSGNYKLQVVTDETEYHYFFAGIDEQNSAYHLKKGETFTTPVLAFTFSKDGLSGASRNFHRWGRKYMLQHGDQERRILLNSWEGVYFNINEKTMDQMIADIASMG